MMRIMARPLCTSGKTSNIKRYDDQNATTKIAKKIILNSKKVKPDIKFKGMFWIFRIMMKRGFNPRDVKYWESKGWTDKNRPWR